VVYYFTETQERVNMRTKQTFSIEEYITKEIKKIAIDKHKDYSDIVEQALMDYIRNEKKKEKE